MTARWLAALFTLSLLVLVVWATWEAWGWVLQKGLAPRIIAVPTALLLLAVFVQQVRSTIGAAAAVQQGKPVPDQSWSSMPVEEATLGLESPEERRRTANVLIWIVGFALAIWLLGFHVGIPLLTILYLRLVGREGWRITLILVVGTWASIALFFDCTVHIYFAPGELFLWLGLDPRPFQTGVCSAVSTMLP